MSDWTVWVTTKRVGFHRWADAPPHRSYLAARHRHLFWFRVEVGVSGADRMIEFHDLLDIVDGYLDGCFTPASDGAIEFGGRSCEMIADELASVVSVQLGGTVTVEVSEDGECGAIVTV